MPYNDLVPIFLMLLGPPQFSGKKNLKTGNVFLSGLENTTKCILFLSLYNLYIICFIYKSQKVQ